MLPTDTPMNSDLHAAGFNPSPLGPNAVQVVHNLPDEIGGNFTWGNRGHLEMLSQRKSVLVIAAR